MTSDCGPQTRTSQGSLTFPSWHSGAPDQQEHRWANAIFQLSVYNSSGRLSFHQLRRDQIECVPKFIAPAISRPLFPFFFFGYPPLQVTTPYHNMGQFQILNHRTAPPFIFSRFSFSSSLALRSRGPHLILYLSPYFISGFENQYLSCMCVLAWPSLCVKCVADQFRFWSAVTRVKVHNLR